MVSIDELKQAIKWRDLLGVEKFVTNGGNVNEPLLNERSVLSYAIHCDYMTEKSFSMLRHPNVLNFSYRDDEITLYLIRAGADVNIRNEHGQTPLLQAIIERRGYKVLQELIDAGSEVNTAECDTKMTPLMHALHYNYNKTLIKSLVHAGANLHCKCRRGWTPLWYAVNHIDSFEIMSWFISLGADVNTRDINNEIILVKMGCGKSCNEDSCEKKQFVDLIVRSGLELKKEDGESVIYSVHCNYLTSLYIKKGVAIDSKRGSNGTTPLMNAVSRGNEGKVRSLLCLFNANPNCVDNDLNTALHHISHPCINISGIITLIVYHGGDLCAKNKNNLTALDIMFENPNRSSSYTRVSPLSVEAIIKHVILFMDENELYSLFKNDYHSTKRRRLCYIDECKKELSKMKSIFVKDDLTVFEFCNLKKLRKSKVIDISADECKYDYDEIKILFPYYKDLIIMRLKDNKIVRMKRILRRSLENIIVKPFAASSSESCSNIELLYDCKYHLARYLNYKHLCSLFFASIEH